MPIDGPLPSAASLRRNHLSSDPRHGSFAPFPRLCRRSLREWAEWTLVRRRMRDHLMAVCRAAMADGGPLVSSIVVNRRLIRTGEMEAETLAGFLAAAHKLGFGWTDGRAFLRAQQEATFRWANELRSLCAAPDEGGRE